MNVVVDDTNAMEVGHAIGIEDFLQLVDSHLDAACSIGEVGVIGLHIGLGQQSVVHDELRIEAYGTCRGQEQAFFLHIACRLVMGDEPSQFGDGHAVIVQQQDFYMLG